MMESLVLLAVPQVDHQTLPDRSCAIQSQDGHHPSQNIRERPRPPPGKYRRLSVIRMIRFRRSHRMDARYWTELRLVPNTSLRLPLKRQSVARHRRLSLRNGQMCRKRSLLPRRYRRSVPDLQKLIQCIGLASRDGGQFELVHYAGVQSFRRMEDALKQYARSVVPPAGLQNQSSSCLVLET